MEQFYSDLEKFNALSKSDKILVGVGKRLASLRLTKRIQFDDDTLSPEEKQLSKQAFTLLYQEAFQANPLAWKILLEEIGKQIKTEALELWAVHFFHRLEILNIENIEVKENLEAIDTLYKEASPLWKDLIDPSGKGFVQYLKKITTKNFDKYFFPVEQR